MGTSTRSRHVLFAISDTGSGHRRAAEAMAALLDAQAGTAVTSSIVDVLRLTNVPVIRAASLYYDWLSTRWIALYNTLFHLTDGPLRSRLVLNIIYQLGCLRLLQELEQQQPQLVVVAHPLAAHLIAAARHSYRLPFRIVTVVTDLVSLHASWGDPLVDRCVVPTPEAWRRLQHWLPTTKLAAAPFPIHPKFTQPCLTREEARRMLRVARSPFTTLITGGGCGAGDVQTLVTRLHRQFPTLQILVVTGRNATLRRMLLAADLGQQVHVYGYVGNMELVMAASDVVITKAGPATILEALAMRRPVLVTGAVGAQEHGNIGYVLAHGLGMYCPTVERCITALATLSEPVAYQACCNRLARIVPSSGTQPLADILLTELAAAPA